ncbi:MAG: PCMD domain-containing protein [Bacteroidaceae bacterium]
MQKYSLFFILLICGTFASCIQDEAPNAECDIQRALLRVQNPIDFFYSQADSVQTVTSADSVINFEVRLGADVTALSPQFQLTEGATITPASGSLHDFSKGSVHYTVHAQDGRWSRTYKVKVSPIKTDTIVADRVSYTFGFEEFALEPAEAKYYYWLEEGNKNYWATGNPGFSRSRSSALPDEYPSIPLREGVSGNCLQLTTRSTGGFGVMVNMRLAAGNVFVGSFDVSQALKDAMLATCFGKPFTQVPIRLKGYYKYTPGKNYQDRDGRILADKTDSLDIYAVFYRNTDERGNNIVLNGNDILTSPYIVSVARIENAGTPTEWREFNLPFHYLDNQIDVARLKNRGYSLAIVFSSSIKGNLFCGAIGSTLLIDEVTLICNKDEE